MTRRRLVPIATILLGLGVLGVIAPEIFRGAVSDLDTFLRSAGLVVALVAWVVIVRRFVSQPAAAALAFIPVAAAIWLVVWPYVRPATEVDEAFPPAASVVTSATTTTTTPSATPSSTTLPSTPLPSTTLPPTTLPPTTLLPPDTTVSTEPVELSRSGFQGLAGHRGSGDAAVYRLANGSILLRFEEVDIGSGPDLEVYLVPGTDQRGLGDAHHVAALTAERGNQNYTVPAGADLASGTWTVLVWCETFAVEIANATLVI